MIIVKDTDEQIVLKNSMRARAWGLVFFVLFGLLVAFTGLAVGVGVGAWVGIPVVLGGLVFDFLVIYAPTHVFKEMTFDRALGQMTVRGGAKPFLVRTRRISRTEIQSLDIRFIPAEWNVSASGVAGHPNRWVLFLIVGSKSVVVYWDPKESTVTHLASRIRAFKGT